MGVDHYEEYSASNIFEKAWVILSKVSRVKDIVQKSQEMNQVKGNLYYENDQIEPFRDEGYKL